MIQTLNKTISPLGRTNHNPFFHVTEFNQSLGAELLTNGDFSAWSGDNPTGWTVSGESGSDPELTERAPGNAHGDAVGVGGAANFYSTATTSQPRISQAVLTVNKYYSVTFEITRRVSGSFAMLNMQNSNNNYAAASGGLAQQIGRASGTSLQPAAVGAAPHDFTLDNLSAMEVSPNTRIAGFANGITELYFDPGVNANKGVEMHLMYRIASGSSNELINCWDVLVRHNFGVDDTYEFRSRLILNGAVTNKTTVQAGKPDAIRVITNGNDHEIYTRNQSDGVWTLRSSFSDSNLNDAEGVNVMYGRGIAPLRVIGWRSDGS